MRIRKHLQNTADCSARGCDSSNLPGHLRSPKRTCLTTPTLYNKYNFKHTSGVRAQLGKVQVGTPQFARHKGSSLRHFLPKYKQDTGEGPSSGLLDSNGARCFAAAGWPWLSSAKLQQPASRPHKINATYRLKHSGVFPKSTEGGGALRMPFKHGKYSSAGREQREVKRQGSNKKKETQMSSFGLLHVRTYAATVWRLARVEQDFAILAIYQGSVSIPLSPLLTHSAVS